jgi:DNA polymerase-1
MLRNLGWTMKRFETALNDGSEPIPEHIMNTFQLWRTTYPKPGYQDVPMEIMLPYVATDVCLVDQLVRKALPVVAYKKQQHIMEQEWDLLPHVYEMERQGIPVDREYLMDAREKLENYIEELKNDMHELAGREFKVGQHQVIKDIYEEKLGERPESTDKKFLKSQGEEDKLAKTITTLRRLEKWLKTYIDRILTVSEYDGKFYTSMNQFNPVSGRFSGDAQQFPKDPIYTRLGDKLKKEEKPIPDEEILYHPRRAFKMRGYYLDFSQVELRVQGHYTMYLGGDVNLCRAYMPFKCAHFETGEIYDYSTVEGRARWSEKNGDASAWIVPETGKPWVPTDVHTMTTLKALRIMGYVPEEMDAKTIKWWRNKGKTFNFMRNYGGGDAMAAETLDITLDQAKAMNRGYTDAFPKVVDYQNMVVKAMHKKGYVENMSGRRYYLSEHWKFYKVANYLIQGSCADDLKKKMVQIARFIKENKLSMRMVLCVHDEIQFMVNDPAEDWAISHIKAMMEDCPDIMVPIVAEVEFSESYWSEKEKVHV